MVGPGIWRETVKNVKKDKCTLKDLENGYKSEKTWKMIHTQCRTGIMARNAEKRGK
jgi:hypothetical protein